MIGLSYDVLSLEGKNLIPASIVFGRMEFSQLRRINEKIQELYEAMVGVVPFESVNKHPFDHFLEETNRIIDSINAGIESVSKQRAEMEGEVEALMEGLKRDCASIEMEVPVIPELCNLGLLREYVRNEVERVRLARKGVESRTAIVIEEIKEIVEDIPDVAVRAIECTGVGGGSEGSSVSLERLRLLEAQRDLLRNERESRERRRDELYEELLVFLSQLQKSDGEVRISQKIFVLEDLHGRYKEEIEQRDREFRGLEAEIRRREGYLGVVRRDIEPILSDDNLVAMREYESHLRDEQRKRFDEIYEKKKSRLAGLLEVFGEEMGEYGRTEEDVEKMGKMIEELESKKELFLSISSLVEKRAELVDKMNEFEKIASDPKRLFRSSFQLISEEKFRNNAYPNLIRIEEAIFKHLDEYEEEFGKLLRNGVDFKESLRNEIENRIVNKTVFINRFDSPTRKRK